MLSAAVIDHGSAGFRVDGVAALGDDGRVGWDRAVSRLIREPAMGVAGGAGVAFPRPPVCGPVTIAPGGGGASLSLASRVVGRG